MAALRTVLNNDECLFFPGSAKDKKRARATWVKKVENMPAHLQYKRGVEEPNAETLKWIAESPMNHLLHFNKNTGVVKLHRDDQGIFEITDSRDHKYRAKYIVLCTGIMDVQPEIQGSIESVFDYANAQTIDYCALCDGHHVLGKRASVIGHSNTAAWVSIMLYEKYGSSEFHLLTNGKTPEFEADAMKILERYKIKIHTNPIKKINGENGELTGFLLENGQSVRAEICFISLGVIVYNELAKQLGAELDERGFVKAQDSGETTVPGLFVAGDIKANTKKQIYTSWDSAVNAAGAVNLKLRVERRQKLLEIT